MKPKVCLIDTNVVVAGLISGEPSSPPVLILDAMLDGKLPYLMSAELLQEYASVLRRPRISQLHALTDAEVNGLLTELVANAIWREPLATSDAPDPGDNPLWALLASQPGSQLVTGDKRLIENPPNNASVISPRRFVDLFMGIDQI